LNSLHLNQFDFNVPAELIAQNPLLQRDQSKLLHYDSKKKTVEHTIFSDIIHRLPSHGVLVFNNTKVIKARVHLHRKSGARIECFFLEKIRQNCWHVLIKNSKKVNENECLVINDQALKIIQKNEKTAIVEIIGPLSDYEFLDTYGTAPLPPYIKSSPSLARYQTVFASVPGAVAAPTASLHFTTELLAKLKQNHIDILYITLHVGLGTFNPIETENIYDHTMHYEHYHINQKTASKLTDAIQKNKPIVAVGTTVVRCLESNFKNNMFHPGEGSTNLYITPQYTFKCINAMVTNFHLPKSSLLILVASFIGIHTVLHLYQTAIKHRYRFFSFGDAMLIT
jgi:S-adenosylmethionine:tRNA ribosyltransferase-isomerase